jgi:hypothetical protein
MNGKIQKIISLIIILIFVFCGFSIDVLYLQSIPVPIVKLKTVPTVHAGVYCLPPNEGGQTPVFDPVIGFCTLPPLDPYGRCTAPYVYSTTNEVCILTPICSGAEYWDANAKKCVAYTGRDPVPGDTTPVFPDNSCAVDLNGNGEVEQDEIFQCTQTPQGYICPQGQTACIPQYTQPTCPAGYTYNSQTQKCEASVTQGVCSSSQVPYTDYQCPTTGQIYPDLTTCNNNCIQTAQCTSQQIWSTCTAKTRSVFCNSRGDVDYSFPMCESSMGIYRFYYTFDNTISASPGSCANGNFLSEAGYIRICFDSSCTVTFYTLNVRGIDRCSRPISAPPSYSNTFPCFYHTEYYSHCCAVIIQNISIPTTTYTCPLGNYPCTGNPPTCTKGQTCVTHTDYTTKWQCSLDGVQYDTQSQCTTNCHSACPAGGTYNPSTGKCEATATCSKGTLKSRGCFTGYSCPLGNHQCQQVGNRWMCSPYQCITQSQIQDEGDLIAAGLEDDGERDANGNCLGTLYIFNGKGMRCRKSGIQTGFHNCCNESRGRLYDSTGSTGLGSVTDAIKVVAAVYQAIKLGSIMYNVQMVTINLTRNTVNVLTGPGSVITYSLNSAEGSAIANTMMQYGTQVGDPSETGAAFIPGSASKDVLVGSTMQKYIQELGPQIAWAIAQLALSKIVKDPLLSSAVNLVGTIALMELGIIPVNYFAIALQVVNLVMALFMQRCDSQDIMTSTLNDSKYCHEVGEYCVKKWPLVGCVQKARGFCCFNSKLARIIHEQGRPQLAGFGPNGGWGEPKNPNCRGFLPEEFQALDFNKIDLSEYIEDIERNINQNVGERIREQFNRSMNNSMGN